MQTIQLGNYIIGGPSIMGYRQVAEGPAAAVSLIPYTDVTMHQFMKFPWGGRGASSSWTRPQKAYVWPVLLIYIVKYHLVIKASNILCGYALA